MGPQEGGRRRQGGASSPAVSLPWRLRMQALIASIFAQVAELGVFFVAAAALTAGALALR